MLAKSTSPETRAAIAAGPQRMNIGSICNPCALKKPRAKATRTGISLFHDKLTKTTRTNLFSCAAALGATNTSTRYAMNQRIKNPLRAVFTYHLLFRKISISERCRKSSDSQTSVYINYQIDCRRKSRLLSGQLRSLFVDSLNSSVIQRQQY